MQLELLHFPSNSRIPIPPQSTNKSRKPGNEVLFGCTFTIDAWEEVGHYSLTFKKYGELEIGEVDLVYDSEPVG